MEFLANILRSAAAREVDEYVRYQRWLTALLMRFLKDAISIPPLRTMGVALNSVQRSVKSEGQL